MRLNVETSARDTSDWMRPLGSACPAAFPFSADLSTGSTFGGASLLAGDGASAPTRTAALLLNARPAVSRVPKAGARAAFSRSVLPNTKAKFDRFSSALQLGSCWLAPTAGLTREYGPRARKAI